MLIVKDRFFCPILTQIIDSFSCSSLNTTFFILKKAVTEVTEYAEVRHNMMMSLKHNNEAI